MKYRSGFVSNSSSSSFVVLSEALTEKQRDMILNCEEWIEFFINLQEENSSETIDGGDDGEDIESTPYYEKLSEKWEYYKSDPWRIEDRGDYIFGETSMDNFNIESFLDYIKVDPKYVVWDDGYNNEPYPTQLAAIERMKIKIRKEKIDKLNNTQK